MNNKVPKQIWYLSLILLLIPIAYSITLEDLINSYDYSYEGVGVNITSINHSGLDVNGSVLYDYLVINITMENQEGNYSIIGDLYKDNQFIQSYEHRIYLNQGINEILLNFSPELMINGTYNLSLTVNKDFLVTYRNQNAYSFDYFDENYEKPEFDVNFVSYGYINSDADEKYEYIGINLSVSSTLADTLEIAAYLTGNNNTVVSRDNYTIQSGTNYIVVKFNSTEIRKNRVKNGKLYLVDVKDGIKYTFPLNQSINYNISLLESSTSMFADSYEDSLVDLNANERAEYLNITVDLDIIENSDYVIHGELYDSYNNYIATINQTFSITTGIQPVDLLINGTKIYVSKLNGPYLLKYLRLIKDGEIIDEVLEPYTTANYTYNHFEMPNLPDLIIPQMSLSGDNLETEIGNNGTIYAFGIVVSYFDQDFNELTQKIISHIASDSAKNISFVINTTNLTKIYAIVDYDNGIEELNESNNLFTYEQEPPLLQQISNITVNETDLVTIIINATDPNCDTLYYYINDSRFTQLLDNVFTWQTPDPSAGIYTVNVSVSDGEFDVSQLVSITVNDVCIPSWYPTNTTCLPSDYFTEWHNDSNQCYAQTGLSSDNNPPANNTYSCEYCASSADCEDGVSCTIDSCNESINSCEDEHIPDDSLCDDSLYCNGVETCDAVLDCQSGTPIDCSGNDLIGISTCDCSPDNNPFTWDYFVGFTSVCDEVNDECTTGSVTLTHTCDITSCGAECEDNNDCTATDCDNLDGCVGNDYYDYDNVTNNCLGDCTCEANSCSSPTITNNDPRCTECQIDDDCNSLDNDYCNGDLIQHNEGRCISYACETDTTTTQDCNDNNNDYCDGTEIKHDDYTCSSAACVLDSTTTVQDCDNGQYCDGSETCISGACISGTPIDCSGNNLGAIQTCIASPDNNPFTWDFFIGFTSVCDEVNDECTTGSVSLTHTCNIADCSAECEQDIDCDDSNDYTEDNCLNDCSCEHLPIECLTDSDCGTNAYLNSPFCQSDDVWQDYITYTCNSPGTPSSSCSDSTTAQEKEACAKGCYQASCMENHGPTIDSYTPINLTPSIDGGVSLDFTATATDPDNDELTYYWSLDSNLVSSQTSYTYKPTYSAGIHIVELEVTDGKFSDYVTWTVTVNEIGITKPDLRLYDLQLFYPQDPSTTTFTIFKFIIKNIGTVIANNVEWQLNTGEGTVTSTDLVDLDPGKTLDVYSRYTYSTSSTYDVTATVDQNNIVDEDNEINNDQTIQVTVS